MNQPYSIGLDIGVASVGWACMTPDFRIPRVNGRYAMGVREFESAETAEARRIQRGTRRRYNRRIKRIQLLQQTISPLFYNDPGFFIKEDEREKHFWRQSNKFENNSLSETLRHLKKNTRKYPTIYHLRHSLITEDKKFHPRLIYLALHNIVKFRGHFLNENMVWNNNENSESVQQLLKELFKELEKHIDNMKKLSPDNIDEVALILEEDDTTNADKRTAILRIVGRELRQPISLLLGLRANIPLMFAKSDNIEMYKEEKLKLSFSDEDITEVFEKLTDEEKLVIEKAQVIYQHMMLKDLLGTATYAAEAKVNAYDEFGEDLRVLKDIYNKHFGEKAYRSMFITSRSNQTKYNNTRDSKLLCTFDKFLNIHKTEDKFYRDLTRKLKKLLENEELGRKDKVEVDEIIDKLEKNQFLQKQKGHMNAAIPHQNNVFEAEMILKQQQKYYPEITDDIINKVLEIIRFRIPYYIGPLVKENNKGDFGWVSRKNEGRIKPWTIDEVIDRSQSAEEFISRMTSYCAYLTDEKVLPKDSLTYEKFELLNELNGIQIRPSKELPNRKFRLSTEVKEWIIEHVFKKYKNVTHRRLQQELKKSPFPEVILDENTDGLKEIHGTQKENQFGTNLATFIDMTRIFGDVNKENFKMIEEIIYWIAVFEEKDILEMKIKEKYSEINQEQLRALVHLNYTGWGRLSKRLIDELPADQDKNLTILDIMKREPRGFMEVLSIEKYNLDERISKMNVKDNEQYTKINYKDIEELQGSPALKKGIWQAVLIIEELVDIFGEPEHIMIEFAREEGEKERTSSVKKQINDLQKAVNKDEKELKSFLKEHSHYEEADYRDNRLYLYVTQQGKCLYSGERLNISRLQDYEIDHILPRSFVKDDSIDNLALVKQKMNQAKGSDKMPLEILTGTDKVKQISFWKKLRENNLISQPKYFRLMKESFTDQDKESFFARQLVETRQITKHVKDLLNERFEKTEIHPVNANIVTNLRKHSGAIKIRNLNNKHHAVDAALTVLIVQFIINKYGHNFLNFNFKYQEARKKWREMLTKYRKNFFLFADIVNYDQFTHFQTGELLTGHQFLSVLNDEMPWQTTKKTGSGEAAFYDETIYSPKATLGRNPQYASDKLNRGVHSGVKVDSSYLISYKYLDKQNREKMASDVVNFLVIEKYQTRGYSEEELALFLAKKVANGEVIKAKIHTRILKHQLVYVDNHPLYFVSSGEMNNAKQFRPGQQTLKKLYQIKRKENITKELLEDTFQMLVNSAIKQFETYNLTDKQKENISEYIDKITDIETFNKGTEELFKMASASAARSTTFGGRYRRKFDPIEARFIHQSTTGLRYRKPKSYKHELWSK